MHAVVLFLHASAARGGHRCGLAVHGYDRQRQSHGQQGLAPFRGFDLPMQSLTQARRLQANE
jgi:hypothetical protein